jgi:hypothetical protein
MMSSHSKASLAAAIVSSILGCIVHWVLYYMPYMLSLGLLGCLFGVVSFILNRKSLFWIPGILLNLHTVVFTLLRLGDAA